MMDFDLVFKNILESFQKEKINFAIIGGFALQAHGMMNRVTQDIDLLVLIDDTEKVKRVMISQGFELRHESKDVMNFFGKEPVLGRVDFIIAHRQYARDTLKKAVEKEILSGKFKIKVITIEDQIGFKVQSSTNDKERYERDRIDIEWLLKSNYPRLNMDLVREYFKIFNRENELEEMINKIKTNG